MGSNLTKILFVAAIACACSPQDSSLVTTQCDQPTDQGFPRWVKGILSGWSNCDLSFDLSGMSYGSPKSIELDYVSGAKCQTTVTVFGTFSVGNFTFAGTTYSGGVAPDPGCSSLDGNYTYAIPTGFTLNLCNGPNCFHFFQ